MAGHRAIGGLGRALRDVDHVGDAVLALAGLAARLAQRPAGAQTPRQLAAQRAARLHVQRLVDRLGRHPHLRPVGELDPQPTGDLLGRVATREILLDLRPQRQVDLKLRRLGAARAPVGRRVRAGGPVAAAAIGVAPQLARDRRGRPAEAPRYAADRLAARSRERDLLALCKRQVASLQVAPAARAYPAVVGDPARALLAVGARLEGGIVDELAALQRGPERLNSLRNHVVSEAGHRHLRSSGCCEDRVNPRFGLRDGDCHLHQGEPSAPITRKRE